MLRFSASCSRYSSSVVWTSQPWSSRASTWVFTSVMRRVMAGLSQRLSNWFSAVRGSARTGAGASGRRSPSGVRRRTRIFTTSRIAGTSQNSAWTPDRESGWVRMVFSSCSCARVGFAAFWFPACPVRTEHIRVPRHSCTVLSARSTIFAMMSIPTPSEVYRIASAFILTST